MFPDNLYISDPTAGLTYIVENDTVDPSKTFPTHDVYAYLICQNMIAVVVQPCSPDCTSGLRLYNKEQE